MMWKKQADILTVSDQIVDKVTGKTFIWTFFNFHEKDRAKTNYFDRSTFDHDKRRTIFIYIFTNKEYEYCFVTTYSKHIHLPLSQHSLVQVRNIRQKYKSSISSKKKIIKSLFLIYNTISILLIHRDHRMCVCIIFARCSRGSNIGWTVGVRHQYNAGLTPQLSVNCVLSRPTPIIISWISPGQIPTNSDQVCL